MVLLVLAGGSGAYFVTFEYGMYEIVLATTLTVAALLLNFTVRGAPSGGNTQPRRAEFKRFQRLYLAGFLLGMVSDWLHGPYIYALYESYGMRPRDIAHLFIGGFGSSMIFGTFAGSFADRWGRKRSALLFCLVYFIACCTKHVMNFWVLLAGRVLAGVACSLLFSVFEAWMVCAHKQHGFREEWLEETFYLAHMGNGMVGALAGVAAQIAADATPLVDAPMLSALPIEQGRVRWGGFVTPFDLSSIALVICAAVVSQWTENYGSAESSVRSRGEKNTVSVGEKKTPLAVTKGTTRLGTSETSAAAELAATAHTASGLAYAARVLFTSRDMMLCGVAAAAFEAAMFVFVFMWTPALEALDDTIPHGIVFSSFMLCSVVGAQLASLLGRTPLGLEAKLAALLAVSAASLAVPALVAPSSESAGPTLSAFLLFEVCIGAYWPLIGTLKSQLVPEAIRSSVYSFYRVPLNLIVLVMLCVPLCATRAPATRRLFVYLPLHFTRIMLTI